MSVLNILCVHRVILDSKVFLVIVASLNPLGDKGETNEQGPQGPKVRIRT